MSNPNLYDNLVVYDFTSNIAGPTLAAQLADFGATVVHVERPVFGDDSRQWSSTSAEDVGGDSPPFCTYNRGKKSLVLDLKDPRGLEIMLDLLEKADILIESFRPGVMDKLGLGYKELHQRFPKLIYASVSCFGQTGPYAARAGYDVIAQAASGMMSMTGERNGPPTKVGVEIGDFCAGIAGWGAVNAALYYRAQTGLGQQVDISLTRVLAYMSFRRDLNATRSGNLHDGLSPYGMYNRSIDESIIIAAGNQNMWIRVCNSMNMAELIDDSRFKTNELRSRNRYELAGIIEDWMKQQPSIDAVCEILKNSGVPFSKVYNQKDIAEDIHYNACGWFAEMPASKKEAEAAGFTPRRIIPTPVSFSEVKPEYKPAPSLGANNYEIMASVGCSKEEVEALETKWRDDMIRSLKK